MNVLIIGGNSRIAGVLGERLRGKGNDVTQTTRRQRLDVDDWSWVSLNLLNPDLPNGQWDVVYILAAITGFAACEKDPGNSWRVNADAPSAFAWQAHHSVPAPRVVFTSSDAVEFASATAYGRQKAYAECNVLAAGGTVARLGFVGDAVDEVTAFLVDCVGKAGVHRWQQ